MLINSSSNTSFNLVGNTINNTTVQNTSTSSSQPVYQSDSISFNSALNETPPTKPDYIPPDPNQPPIDNTKFFDKPMVRIGGMMLGAGALLGGAGYLIGSAFGSAAMGATIGATLGVLAPIGLLGYALYSWGKNS